jgi:hypothetical protein
MIDALRAMGADKFDPVRLHYLEVLAQRASAHEGAVKRILDATLAKALDAFKTRFELAQREARDAVEHIAPTCPQAVPELQRLLDAADFKAVAQRIATLKKTTPRASLGELARYMAQHTAQTAEGGFDGGAGQAGLRLESTTTSYFRNTWSKLSVDKQVTQALVQAPKNAGPINSHNLLLRSLALMRDISPDYLNRFTSYADTLLCLDQGGKGKPAPAKKTADGEGAKKPKSRRVSAG